MSYREVASRVGEYVIQIGGTEYSSANSPWRSFKTATLGWALGILQPPAPERKEDKKS